MPCDRQYLFSEEFTAENRQYLEETVRRLGWKMRGSNLIVTDAGGIVRLQDGKAVCEDREAITKLKYEYGVTGQQHVAAFYKGKGAIITKLPNGKLRASFKKGL